MSLFKSIADIDSLENRDPEMISRLIRLFKPLFWRYFQPDIRGLERIPTGPGLFVGNHSGGMLMPDLFIFGMALHEHFGMAGLPFGMAHEFGLRVPLLNQLFLPIGAVRGCPENARRLLARGEKLLIYPGGELDLMRPFRDRHRIVFGPHRGYIRLALQEGVPIIPVVSCGAHETLFIIHDNRWLAQALGLDRFLSLKTWPLLFCLPWGLWCGPPPPHFPFPSRIHMEVCSPITFKRKGTKAASDSEYVEACHRQVHAFMENVLEKLAVERRRRKNRWP